MTRIPSGAPASEPLPLEFAPAVSRLPERITPMRPTDGEGPFDDPRYFFEPWWPGIRAFVMVDAGVVRLRAEALTDPTPVFPELAGIAGLLRTDGVVLDVTLMVLDARGRPSHKLLERRLREGGESRASAGNSAVVGGSTSAGTAGLVGTAALVAADLLFLDGVSLAGRPFGERRGDLAALMAPSPWCLAGRGFVGDGTTVAEALGAMGFRALSARRLDAPLRTGAAADAWYRVPVAAAPRELPPLLAVFRRLPL